MIKVSIVGATGYTGFELLKLLIKHPSVEVVSISALAEKPLPIADIFPGVKDLTGLICDLPDVRKEAENDSELVFLAVPHKVAMEWVPLLVKKGKKVIDLSADYRLKDVKLYEKTYGVVHRDVQNIKKAVYGLPEINKEKIQTAELIANPGCFPTSAILSLYPLVKNSLIENTVFIDAKTGISGAGRKPSLHFSFPEASGNVYPYKANKHQHMPEIVQEIEEFTHSKINCNFIPHIIPTERGILETIYTKPKKGIKMQDLKKAYQDAYLKEPFVRITEELPGLKQVTFTNFCDIGFMLDEKNGLLLVVSAIDNLLKGASGQAVQNMNIMYGLEEKEGLF